MQVVIMSHLRVVCWYSVPIIAVSLLKSQTKKSRKIQNSLELNSISASGV